MSKIFKHIPLSYIDGKSLAPSYYKRFMINYNNNTAFIEGPYQYTTSIIFVLL